MKSLQAIAIAFITSTALLSGCASTSENNYFNSALWMQSAAESKASSIQTYNVARQTISMALNDSSWSAALEQSGDYSMLPPAIILDVDETVLSNSKYIAKMVLGRIDNTPENWDMWISLAQATAVPGAVDFIKAMSDKNIEIIYLTNRECRPTKTDISKCPQKQDTIDNLNNVGLKNINPDNVLLKKERPEWTSEKKSRREYLAKKYRILMLFGDNLGDFLPNVKKNITPEQRDKLVHQNTNKWGTKWYMLSNPAYGSWLYTLEDPKSKYLIDY